MENTPSHPGGGLEKRIRLHNGHCAKSTPAYHRECQKTKNPGKCIDKPGWSTPLPGGCLPIQKYQNHQNLKKFCAWLSQTKCNGDSGYGYFGGIIGSSVIPGTLFHQANSWFFQVDPRALKDLWHLNFVMGTEWILNFSCQNPNAYKLKCSYYTRPSGTTPGAENVYNEIDIEPICTWNSSYSREWSCSQFSHPDQRNACENATTGKCQWKEGWNLTSYLCKDEYWRSVNDSYCASLTKPSCSW